MTRGFTCALFMNNDKHVSIITTEFINITVSVKINKNRIVHFKIKFLQNENIDVFESVKPLLATETTEANAILVRLCHYTPEGRLKS